MSLYWLLQLLVVPFSTLILLLFLLCVPVGGGQPNVWVPLCLLPPVEPLDWPELHFLPLMAVPHLDLLPSPSHNLCPMHLCCERQGVVWRLGLGALPLQQYGVALCDVVWRPFTYSAWLSPLCPAAWPDVCRPSPPCGCS